MEEFLQAPIVLQHSNCEGVIFQYEKHIPKEIEVLVRGILVQYSKKTINTVLRVKIIEDYY